MLKWQTLLLIAFVFTSCVSSINEDVEYYDSGEVKKISHYDNDMLIKEIKYDESGIKKESKEYSIKETDTIIKSTYYKSSGDIDFKKESINGRQLKYTKYYEGGKIAYEEDIASDSWRTWYENGVLSAECDYKKGKYVKYYETGLKRESGTVINYEKDSLWTFYSPSGELVQEILYNQGKVIEMKVYNQAVVDSLFSDE